MTWPGCRSVLVSVVTLAIAGCGAAETTPTGGPVTTGIAAPPPTMAPPATALYVPPDPNATVGTSGSVEVVLLPGEEATGSQLSNQFGNAVVVTYGELEQLSL